MGQKTHPIGLRVGIHRKWASSWYGSNQEKNQNTSNFSQFAAKGVVSSRGGFFVEGIQEFVEVLLRRYAVSKLTISRRFRPVDFRCFKGTGGHRYCFIFYTQLISGSRRKKLFLKIIKILKMNKSIVYPFLLAGSIDEFFFSKKDSQVISTNKTTVSKLNQSKNTVLTTQTKAYNNTNFVELYLRTEGVLFDYYKEGVTQVPTSSVYSFRDSFYNSFTLNVNKNPNCLSTYNNTYVKLNSQFEKVSSYKLSVVQQIVFAVNYSVFFPFKNNWKYLFDYNFNNFSFITQDYIYNQTTNVFDYKQKAFTGIRDKYLFNRFNNGIYLNSNLTGFPLVYFNKIISYAKALQPKEVEVSGVAPTVLRSTTFKRRWARYNRSRAVQLNNFIKQNIQTSKVLAKSVKVGNINTFKVPFGFKRNYYFKSSEGKKLKSVSSHQKNSKVSFNLIGNQVNHVVPETFTLQLVSNDKDIYNPAFTDFSQLKVLLSVLTGYRFSIYHVNALALSRFAFDKERFDHNSRNKGDSSSRVKTSQNYLESIERERVSRYRYVAVHIQDLIRISFFSIYLKKASFLASFFAYTLSKLPRNRKETLFVRFLIKLIKVFASQRKEIIGVRIRFQGRVNRWRRTKYIIGEKGRLSFYTYSSRREFGRAQAITRKGALGIRVWICYEAYFTNRLQNTIYHYVKLPQSVYGLKASSFVSPQKKQQLVVQNVKSQSNLKTKLKQKTK